MAKGIFENMIWEVILYSSLTINCCLLWSQIVSSIFRLILPVVSSQYTRGFVVSQERSLELFSKMCTDSLFHVLMPSFGFYLISSTNILSDPFFTFNGAFLIIFSIQVGRLSFVIFRDTLSKDLSLNRATLIHHLVAVMIYFIILRYKQSTITGVVGLILEGHMLFVEGGQFIKHFDRQRIPQKFLMFIHVLNVCSALIFRAVIPITLICLASIQSKVLTSLFGMDYIPLASFFLASVFYLTISFWIIVSQIHQTYQACTTVPKSLKVSPLVRIVISNSFDNPGLQKTTKDKLEDFLEKTVLTDPKNEDTQYCKVNEPPSDAQHYSSDTCLLQSNTGIINCCLVKKSAQTKHDSTTDFVDVPL